MSCGGLAIVYFVPYQKHPFLVRSIVIFVRTVSVGLTCGTFT